MRILITAGPTREYLDDVRYLSNDSSGRMGYALAESIVGVEPTPLAAYLAGLTVIQSTVMTLAMLASRVAFGPQEQGAQSRRTQRARWAGGAVCLTGAYFLAAAVLNA